MIKFGKVGVAIALSLMLGLILFIPGVFAHPASHSKSNETTYAVLAVDTPGGTTQALKNFAIQPGTTWQINNYQQSNGQQVNQRHGQCDSASDCTQASRCIRIYRIAWGWIFLCNDTD